MGTHIEESVKMILYISLINHFTFVKYSGEGRYTNVILNFNGGISNRNLIRPRLLER